MVSLQTALCLPVLDIEALIHGYTILALPKMFIHPGQRFALYPVDTLLIPLSIQQYYRSSFSLNSETAIKSINFDKFSIKLWASCQLCQIIDQTQPLDLLSQLTIWNLETFQKIIDKQQNIFLAYLRVYFLSEFIQVPVNENIRGKIGKFVSIAKTDVSEDNPVLNTEIFTQRKYQLEIRKPSLYTELEEIHSVLSKTFNHDLFAKKLENDIRIFLYRSNQQISELPDPSIDWIKSITVLGDRSVEENEKKSNYQAGTDFENIVRQSLEFLGFVVDPSHKGGAGGLDLVCSLPYPLICECKSGRSIPSNTVEELINLGGKNLGADQFFNSSKLIIGPGDPTQATQKSANEWKISIMNPMTLQKLAEFNAKYPGAINLVELQKYLLPGQIDHRIEEYLTQLETEIKVRSHVIEILKNYLQRANEQVTVAGVESLHLAYVTSNSPRPLKSVQELHDILIELSSPLTGYLGRERGNDWKSDRFYYLRDLKPRVNLA